MSSQVFAPARRRLNARQAETVERLMAAGLAELRAVGHEALTIRTVAQRAGVSPATAYTYLASKNHLFAELFLRHLTSAPPTPTRARTTTGRVQAAARALTRRIAEEPALAAAVTPALLGSDPDVERLRLRIGAEMAGRLEAALAEPDPAVLETLVFTFSGALLQAGMGLIDYADLADRMESCVAVILRGNE